MKMEVIGDIFGNVIYLWNMSDQLQRKLKSSNHARRKIDWNDIFIGKNYSRIYMTQIVRKIIYYLKDINYKICSWWNINISKSSVDDHNYLGN